MSIIVGILIAGALLVIANLLNEILCELRLAKKYREDINSQRIDNE